MTLENKNLRETVENRLHQIIGDPQAVEEIKALTALLETLQETTKEPVGMKFYYTTPIVNPREDIYRLSPIICNKSNE